MSLNEAVEEQYFIEQLEKLKERYPRIYEIKDAIIWTLSRKPNSGTPLPNATEFRIFKTDSLNTEDPGFWVLFKYESMNERVRFFSIAPIISEDE
jgi:hypothetical protein